MSKSSYNFNYIGSDHSVFSITSKQLLVNKLLIKVRIESFKNNRTIESINNNKKHHKIANTKINIVVSFKR